MVADMHIMVAEDDQRLARLLERGLSRQGHVVDVVHNGPEALALGASGNFDVLVLDVMMPGLDGFTVVRGIRGQAVTIPVLMLTARSGVDDRVRGLENGADDYLVKRLRSRSCSRVSTRWRAAAARPRSYGSASSRLTCSAARRRGTTSPLTSDRLSFGCSST